VYNLKLFLCCQLLCHNYLINKGREKNYISYKLWKLCKTTLNNTNKNKLQVIFEKLRNTAQQTVEYKLIRN